MYACLGFVIEGLHRGESTLLHCKQGKHRSGVFVSCVLALVFKWSLDAAMQFYFNARPLARNRDQWIVNAIAEKLELQDLLDEINRRGMFRTMLADIVQRCTPKSIPSNAELRS